MSMEETKQIIVDQNAQINSIGENLEHKAECLKVAEGKIRQLEQTCNQLRDELLALSTKLERESITYQEEKNLYSTQVEDLMKNLEGLKIIVEEKEAEISSLNIKLDIAMTDKARIIALDQERSNNVLNLEKQVQILSDRIEAITLEKEHLVLIHQEEKDEAASKLQETCDSLKSRYSTTLNTEIDKQKQMYESQIASLNTKLRAMSTEKGDLQKKYEDLLESVAALKDKALSPPSAPTKEPKNVEEDCISSESCEDIETIKARKEKKVTKAAPKKTIEAQPTKKVIDNGNRTSTRRVAPSKADPKTKPSHVPTKKPPSKASSAATPRRARGKKVDKDLDLFEDVFGF
eukprot:TRINITY_DN297_c0_g1_i14.p1 TRINITY_DN297_c0_g1~~TRINITY_DN297_c0_g1_i14.p1  ORF type:complete len:348 (-),score=91.02 TRINITY_DN297_c0_g1_i14:84-1127(-)